MLQPLDIVLALKLAIWEGDSPSFEALARSLCISTSSAYRSFERAKHAGLVMDIDARKTRKKALLELLIHGAKYVYYVRPGETTRGIPTAHAAPPLDQLLGQTGDVYVWPYVEGSTRGQAITPLYKDAPVVAKRDARLYELLALVDALRVGRARERTIAADELEKRLA